MNYAFYNGEYAPQNELKISLYDRSIFFGDGVYDCIIGGKRGVYQLHKHLNRLRTNTKALYLDFPYSDDELCDIIGKLICLSKLECFIIYISVSRYAVERKHYCPDFNRSNLLITISKAEFNLENKPISLLTCEDIRHRMCNVKTLNLLPSVLAARYAEVDGCEETVFMRNGIVTECAHSNISIMKDGALYTHPLSRDILPGITRENLIHVCKEMGIQVNEICFYYDELISADEVIVTSTTHFARRAEKIDKISINYSQKSPFSEISRRLYADFLESCC